MYDRAGKVRTVDIAKGNIFCKVMFIEEQAEEIFKRLCRERNLADLKQEVFCVT